MAQVVTSVGEGAFIGAEGNLTSGAARQTGASILGNEARQNSKLREFLGLDYFNGLCFFPLVQDGAHTLGSAVNFDTPLTASQAYSLAEPFFKCSSSNVPIEFTLIPPLMANFTGNSTAHMPGDTVTLMWNSSSVYLGDDVHIQFLAGLCTLTQTETGMGTTALPSGVNDTVSPLVVMRAP